MKKILTFLILFQLFFVQLSCFAQSKDFMIEAEWLEKDEAKAIVEKKVRNKYKPLKLTIANNKPKTLVLPAAVYYTDEESVKHKAPNSDIIWDKTKRRHIRRAIIWGVIGGGPLSLITVPVSLAHSNYRNPMLEENILKLNYRAKHVYQDETFTTFVFIPKKHKDAESISLKCLQYEGEECFDVEIPLEVEDL